MSFESKMDYYFKEIKCELLDVQSSILTLLCELFTIFYFFFLLTLLRCEFMNPRWITILRNSSGYVIHIILLLRALSEIKRVCDIHNICFIFIV